MGERHAESALGRIFPNPGGGSGHRSAAAGAGPHQRRATTDRARPLLGVFRVEEREIAK